MPVFKYCGLQKQSQDPYENLSIWRGKSQDGNNLLNARRAGFLFGHSL